jgi:hypothetical protein
MTVSGDPAVVEAQIVEGRLGCPCRGCAGVLCPWGWARERVVETGVAGRGLGVARFAPRRGRCPVCGKTQVLLPVLFLSRRADSAGVIGRAVELGGAGCGHRKIAGVLGRPATTVRGWLRSARVVAVVGTGALWAVASELAPDAAVVYPRGGGTLLGRFVGVLSSLAAAAGARWRQVPVAWVSAGAAVCRCRLLRVSWWVGGVQHELALTPAWLVGAGSRAGP